MGQWGTCQRTWSLGSGAVLPPTAFLEQAPGCQAPISRVLWTRTQPSISTPHHHSANAATLHLWWRPGYGHEGPSQSCIWECTCLYLREGHGSGQVLFLGWQLHSMLSRRCGEGLGFCLTQTRYLMYHGEEVAIPWGSPVHCWLKQKFQRKGKQISLSGLVLAGGGPPAAGGHKHKSQDGVPQVSPCPRQYNMK